MVKTTYLYYIKIKNMTQYNNFAASKMSNNPKFEVIVSYTDFLGKTHNIVCKSRPKLKEANEFLKMFKTESVAINKILAEYPVVAGKFPKKYHSEIKKELAIAGFGSVSNFLIK
jgi:predicted TIM-barrel enzyme